MKLNFETKIEHIGNHIKEIESSRTDIMALIYDLKREVSRVASVSNNNNNCNNESSQTHIVRNSNIITITDRVFVKMKQDYSLIII